MSSTSPIILVEDEDATRSSIALLIRELGYEVTEFSDADSAWTSFDKAPVPIVISDWKLPGIDGVEFCRRIRNRKMTPYTYFILLTAANPGPVRYHYAIGSEVDSLVLKPIEFSGLWRRLQVAERLLGLASGRRQWKAHLSICACCHKIRDQKSERWISLEEFVTERTGSRFSHGYCPDCEATALAALKNRDSHRIEVGENSMDLMAHTVFCGNLFSTAPGRL